MKLLLVGNFSQKGTLEWSYARAFKSLVSCQIDHFDMEKAKSGVSWLLARNRFTRRLASTYIVQNANRSLVRKVHDYWPDVLVIWKGSDILPGTLGHIKAYVKPVLINIFPDTLFNLNTAATLSLPIFDVVFSHGKYMIPAFKALGSRRVEYLPCAWDSFLHPRIQLNFEEQRRYQSDLVFIGIWCPEREELLEKLADFNLAIWGGDYWKKRTKNNSPLRSKWRGKQVVGREYAKVLAASKICLNLINPLNGHGHNMRTFEAPGCGAFVIARRTPEQSEIFVEDKEIVCFNDAQELRQKIEYYLANDDDRKRIAEAGHRKVQHHTYRNRAEQILRIVKEIFMSQRD